MSHTIKTKVLPVFSETWLWLKDNLHLYAVVLAIYLPALIPIFLNFVSTSEFLEYTTGGLSSLYVLYSYFAYYSLVFMLIRSQISDESVTISGIFETWVKPQFWRVIWLATLYSLAIDLLLLVGIVSFGALGYISGDIHASLPFGGMMQYLGSEMSSFFFSNVHIGGAVTLLFAFILASTVVLTIHGPMFIALAIHDGKKSFAQNFKIAWSIMSHNCFRFFFNALLIFISFLPFLLALYLSHSLAQSMPYIGSFVLIVVTILTQGAGVLYAFTFIGKYFKSVIRENPQLVK